MSYIQGISAYNRSGYTSLPQNNMQNRGYNSGSYSTYQNDPSSSFFDNFKAEAKAEKERQKQKMREMLRDLKQTQTDKQALTSPDKVSELLGMEDSQKADSKEKDESNYTYNYKEVSSKIQRAKTTQGASVAVLAAKRKVLEVKRKLAFAGGDSEKLQAALAHAQRMEMVARKKKHHIELEELVAVTGKRDEAADNTKDLRNSIILANEETLSKKEDKIFEAKENMSEELLEDVSEETAVISEEELAKINQMIAEFGEEELKQLEESMEMLETMEVVDPHMSKEDFEELKRKHRASENKAIMKADMDYLKAYIKMQFSEGSTVKNTSFDMPSSSLNPIADPQGIGVSISPADISTPVSVDIRI